MSNPPYVYEGIRVWGPTISGTKVINNIIINPDDPTRQGGIVLYSANGPSYNLAVSGNTLEKCGGNGIYFYNVHESLFSDNIVNIPVGRTGFDSQGGSSSNFFTDNLVSTY